MRIPKEKINVIHRLLDRWKKVLNEKTDYEEWRVRYWWKVALKNWYYVEVSINIKHPWIWNS